MQIGNPTLPAGWGSYHYDDEGIPAKQKILIKNGIINEFITNTEAAFRLNIPRTGGSRFQSSTCALLYLGSHIIERCRQLADLPDISYR